MFYSFIARQLLQQVKYMPSWIQARLVTWALHYYNIPVLFLNKSLGLPSGPSTL